MQCGQQQAAGNADAFGNIIIRALLTRFDPAAALAEMRDADVSLLPSLLNDPPDAVFIALHGSTGEDGSLRGVLELCGVPYVGPDAFASRLAWDKPSAKAVLREHHIPTPDWVALPHDRLREVLGRYGRLAK